METFYKIIGQDPSKVLRLGKREKDFSRQDETKETQQLNAVEESGLEPALKKRYQQDVWQNQNTLLILSNNMQQCQFLVSIVVLWLRQGSSDGKISACRFSPRVGKIPQRREWLPTAVVLPGKFHGQRSLVSYSPRGCKEPRMTEATQHTHTHTHTF